MPKTQSHSLSSTGKEPLESVEYINFKVADRATIKSNHPIFPSINCTITALPSPDAAIVELEGGVRERLLLKYLEPLDESRSLKQVQKLTLNRFEIIEELSPDEERERHRLELKVERAFYEAGAGLRDLRDLRLYRSTHKTFEQYCQDRFGHSRQKSNYLIGAADVYKNLTTNCCQNSADDLTTNRAQILPTLEGQARPLTKLQPEEQRLCWQQAVDLADGKVPSGRIVKGVVERLKEKPLNLATDFCFVGDVFTLNRLEASERKYNGYPCVAVELHDFTINVEVYDTILAVKPENLKKIDAPDVRRQLPAIQKRIKRVRNAGMLDRSTCAVLEHLGQQMYLTPMEEKLLCFLEKEYGIQSQ